MHGLGKEIEKQTQGIFPLKVVLIRKVKIIKKPKFDITKVMELHGNGDGDAGVEMVRPEAEDAMNTVSADTGSHLPHRMFDQRSRAKTHA